MAELPRLKKYLELDTWTIEQAAYLVSGIDYKSFDDITMPMLFHGIVGGMLAYQNNATDLAGVPINRNNSTAFDNASRIKEIWNSRINPSTRVSPIDFVAWCKTKNIDTGWITNADEWRG